MIAEQLELLFGLMIIGYWCNKHNVIDNEAIDKISRLLLDIAVPASIIDSVIGVARDDNGLFGKVILAAGVLHVLTPIVSIIMCRLLNLGKTANLTMTYSNLGYMGIPIFTALYGKYTVLYVAIFIMFATISQFSYGIALLMGKNRQGVKNQVKLMFNAGILSSFVAILIYVLQIPIFPAIGKIVNILGNITTPLAMLIIGASIGKIKIKEVFKDEKVYVVCLIKMVIYPLLTYLIAYLFTKNRLIIALCVILTGVPTGANVTMLCCQYNGDVSFASKVIFMTSVISIITIPMMVFFITK